MDTQRPASVATRLATFLAEHPGEQFRCCELATMLDVTTQRAATECGRLYRNNRIMRVHVEVAGLRQPVTYYKARPDDR